MSKQEERTCRCGKKFTAWTHIEYNPYDYMCPDCNKKDGWNYHTRCIGINKKIRCIRCGWKLGYKDSSEWSECHLEIKCKCCGLRFTIWHQEPY